MTNKAIEALIDGSLGDDFWTEAHYKDIDSDIAEELTESTGVKIELDDDGTLVIEGATVRLVDSFDGKAPMSEFWVVLSVEKDGITRYVRNDGWFYSNSGGRFDKGEGVEVFPFKKTFNSWSPSKDDLNKTIDYTSIAH